MKQETLETHENQAYPFREIIRLLGADNEVSRNPVFDAMLIVQNFEAAEFQLKGLTFLPYQSDEKEIQHTSKVDFTIEAVENEAGGDICFTLEYCTRLYKRETMERFARHFINIIREAAAEPDIRLADIDVMDKAEKQQLLETFNDTSHKSGKGIPKMVLDRFEDQAAGTPDRAAITAPCPGAQGAVPFPADYISITYRELNEKSNRLAHLLRQKGVRPESIVGIMMESCMEMAIAIWGILKAGGSYLPIETDYPRDRIQYMINDSKAKILLSEVSEVSEVSGEAEVIKLSTLIEEFPGHPTPLTLLTHPTHLCYIIYTSGTSGRPKGVMVEHGNLANYVNAVENEIDIRSNDTVLQQGSIAFDAFVEEFYPILVRGGRVAIPGRILVRDIPGLCVFIARNQVSMISSAPQLVNELNKALREGLPTPLDSKRLLASLRIVVAGGDVLRADYIDKILEIAEVYNTYGPTESTVCATYYRCLNSPDLLTDVPIGKPLARYRVYILGRYGNLLPINVGGELCVAGPGITRGYMNQPGLTREKFQITNSKLQIPNQSETEKSKTQNTINKKFLRGVQGGSFYKKSPPGRRRHYKTGDLARWLSDGNIEFLGRIDRQVKIRGYRIELAEIESRLAGLAAIKEAVVVDRERVSGEKFLAAYVVCNGPIDAAEVKSRLARDLPDYMIPPYIVEVEEIPWTTLGKVDRKHLPHPDARSGSLQPFAAPESQKEKQLAKIWKEILETDRVGKDDNFFDLGGTSLDIIKVNTRIKEEFKKQIPVVSLFKYTTIRSLVHYLDEQETKGNIGISEEKQKEMDILEA
ncbi:MAG: amino acid adenylation domain-containing protein, partial [Candidatus Aminicenantes bacterium]|nr:amino acid adenylation domain-containing protein [Candidatus Aminicenantes bacterium]